MAEDVKPPSVLFSNVNVFDGENEKLIKNANVLVEGNKIKTVSTSRIDTPDAKVIDGKGRTLMPGLIDAHWHSMFAYVSMAELLTSNIGYINVADTVNRVAQTRLPGGSLHACIT